MQPKRNLVKIIIGIVLLISSIGNFPMMMKYPNTTEGNAAFFTGICILLGSFYLLYRGFYPPNS